MDELVRAAAVNAPRDAIHENPTLIIKKLRYFGHGL